MPVVHARIWRPISFSTKPYRQICQKHEMKGDVRCSCGQEGRPALGHHASYHAINTNPMCRRQLCLLDVLRKLHQPAQRCLPDGANWPTPRRFV